MQREEFGVAAANGMLRLAEGVARHEEAHLIHDERLAVACDVGGGGDGAVDVRDVAEHLDVLLVARLRLEPPLRLARHAR
eukprot:CAMPEP_0195604498 /NCGR_PEP_ID=MMETSP0815-20121206/6674_1 /TAXON_ID=97485 /ORGANISM="Prymnesium parvum, Strain Texoma1" /LENGTH=79 /DNA_ID=CAMNT_0040744157 /DNA_START=446 /DNA_END=682 /DNA_ORIENTATION=+